MKTAELTGALLDYWVARAEGQGAADLKMQGGFLLINPSKQGSYVRPYMPSTDWADGGPLIEKYHLNISETDPPGWVAWSNDLDREYGDTPPQAICRAVVRAAFGDEVEDVPCG